MPTARTITSSPIRPDRRWPILSTNDYFPDYAAGQPYRCLRGGTWWNGNATNDFDYGHARVSNRDPAWFLGGGPPGDPYGQWSQTGFRVMRQEMIPQTVGLFTNLPGVQPGYTLMSPMQVTARICSITMANMSTMWTSAYTPGRAELFNAERPLVANLFLGFCRPA